MSEDKYQPENYKMVMAADRVYRNAMEVIGSLAEHRVLIPASAARAYSEMHDGVCHLYPEIQGWLTRRNKFEYEARNPKTAGCAHKHLKCCGDHAVVCEDCGETVSS